MLMTTYTYRQMQSFKETGRKFLEEKKVEDSFRRTHLANYWGQNAKVFKAEALKVVKENADRMHQEHRQQVKEMHHEWARREYCGTRMQVEASGYFSNNVSDPEKKGFSLFGQSGLILSSTDGGTDMNLEAQEAFGIESSPDTHEIHVFSSEPAAFYEESKLYLMESKADTDRLRTLYEALRNDSRDINESMERMCQMREIVEKDIFLVKKEETLVVSALIRPLMGQPSLADMKINHDRHGRMRLLEGKARDLQHSINLSDMKKRHVDSQMLTLAKRLAVSVEQNKGLSADLNLINNGQGMLPIVIGKSISTVRGLSINTAMPKEFMNAVRHQSKFVGLQRIGIDIQKLHKDVKQVDRNLWMERLSCNDIRNDVHRIDK